MTTTAEKILIMQAYESGKDIECSSRYAPKWWAVTPNPSWDWYNVNYRIRVVETKPTIYYKVVYKRKGTLSANISDRYYASLEDFHKSCEHITTPTDYIFCYLDHINTISDTPQK